jgi:predicted DCC family thiol-disulfide oxidoreductase YuxK
MPGGTMKTTSASADARRRFALERDTNGALAGDAFVLFDGACGFCTWIATRWRAHTPPGVRWVPYQWLEPHDFARFGTTPQECRRAVRFVDERSRVHGGASAVNAILAYTRGGRALVTALYVLFPLLLLEHLGYALVARFRVPISALLGTRRCALVDDPR